MSGANNYKLHESHRALWVVCAITCDYWWFVHFVNNRCYLSPRMDDKTFALSQLKAVLLRWLQSHEVLILAFVEFFLQGLFMEPVSCSIHCFYVLHQVHLHIICASPYKKNEVGFLQTTFFSFYKYIKYLQQIKNNIQCFKSSGIYYIFSFRQLVLLWLCNIISAARVFTFKFNCWLKSLAYLANIAANG